MSPNSSKSARLLRSVYIRRRRHRTAAPDRQASAVPARHRAPASVPFTNCSSCRPLPAQRALPAPAVSSLVPISKRECTKPKWSFHGRVLPDSCIPLDSPSGRRMLLESLGGDSDDDPPPQAYYPLSQSFLTQTTPAACGPATLAMILNALRVDPHVVLTGGWRFYDESVVIDRCCVDPRALEERGITMHQFSGLARCNGLSITERHPCRGASVDDLRSDLGVHLARTDAFIAASFSRAAMGQTGDGHFSPLGAYHSGLDAVLVFDVARFKYGAYWVNVGELHASMCPEDPETGESRGWFVVEAPSVGLQTQRDDGWGRDFLESKRPYSAFAEVSGWRASGGQGRTDVCPVGRIKVTYCPAAMGRGRRVIQPRGYTNDSTINDDAPKTPQ
mmetsp:Transcript_14458/g.28932  ORF Transcript_14458/g.28932 Transcript_14458/m.28932 type:complete len:390 (-) Transcript_14458:318-1487(-)